MVVVLNIDELYSTLSELRDGGLAGAEAKDEILFWFFKVYWRAIVGSEKLGLVSLVYQYLTGNVDRRSSKAYSRSSLDFRDIYVAVVLFLGAYVWIKFREVAPKGVQERKRKDKQGRIKVVGYEPRFKPPRENRTVFQWIYLGQYATPEEAAILYQIAAFYYNEGEGGSLDLEDGRCFSIPPMPVEEQSHTGEAKRAAVKVQAMKVYEDFKKEKAEKEMAAKADAAWWQECLEALEDPATPSQAVDLSEASLLNSGEHPVPLVVSPAENSGMATTRLGVEGFECAPQSLGGVHEGFVTSNGHSLGFQEESTIPTSQLTPGTQSGMGIINSNQLNSLQVVHNQQDLLTYLQQQVQVLGAQVSVLQNQQGIQQQQLDQLLTENLMLRNQERIQKQQLEDSRMHISQLESQHCVQLPLQVVHQGVPSFELVMEQSRPRQNHPCRPPGSAFGEVEAQEAGFI